MTPEAGGWLVTFAELIQCRTRGTTVDLWPARLAGPLPAGVDAAVPDSGVVRLELPGAGEVERVWDARDGLHLQVRPPARRVPPADLVTYSVSGRPIIPFLKDEASDLGLRIYLGPGVEGALDVQVISAPRLTALDLVLSLADPELSCEVREGALVVGHPWHLAHGPISCFFENGPPPPEPSATPERVLVQADPGETVLPTLKATAVSLQPRELAALGVYDLSRPVPLARDLECPLWKQVFYGRAPLDLLPPEERGRMRNGQPSGAPYGYLTRMLGDLYLVVRYTFSEP